MYNRLCTIVWILIAYNSSYFMVYRPLYKSVVPTTVRVRTKPYYIMLQGAGGVVVTTKHDMYSNF